MEYPDRVELYAVDDDRIAERLGGSISANGHLRRFGVGAFPGLVLALFRQLLSLSVRLDGGLELLRQLCRALSLLLRGVRLFLLPDLTTVSTSRG